MSVERLIVDKVTRSYGSLRALDTVSLIAEAGQVTALLGGNGAGKSTLMKVLATLTRADTGRVMFDEHDILDDLHATRRTVGYLGHESMLDAVLTGRENLALFCKLYAVEASRINPLIERFDADTFADRPVRTYSRGQEQKIALCRALLHDPSVLLLDEPSTGLDQESQKRLWGEVREQADQGRVVLFSTHDQSAAQGIPDCRYVLNAGKLVE